MDWRKKSLQEKPAGHRRCQDGILTDISMEGGGLVPVSGAVFAVKSSAYSNDR